MITIRAKEVIILTCLLAAVAVISGCAGTASPVVDVKTAGDSILNARESLTLARSAEADKFAPEELAQAEGIFVAAQEALEKGNIQKAADLAFQANIEGKIAAAMAQTEKARNRAIEIEELKPKILWETKIDEVAAAKMRQTIAEKKAFEAQKKSEMAAVRTGKQIQKSKAELAIAKVELTIDSAEQEKASKYALDPYSKAKSAVEVAKSAIITDDYIKALTLAEEASRYALNAVVQARTRREAEFEESLRDRDRAVAGMAKAEITIEKASEDIAGHYAQEMHTKATELLAEAKLALEGRKYDQAISLAEQSYISASSALAEAEAEIRQTQVREAQEDAEANALDAVAKAERSMNEAKDAGAEELAEDTYRKASATMQRAMDAMESQNFENAYSLAQESTSHSITALTMAKAKTERLRKLEEIENSIIAEAEKIPEVTVRKTARGVIISMGGDLFSKGGSQIRDDAKVKLKTVAEILKKYSDYKVVIEGHTDSVGSDDSNLKISRERANNFLTHIAEQEGIPLERLSSIGYGESHPIVSNINEEGRRQNRRVDIVILTAPVSP